MGKRRKLLVPEARTALQALKEDVVREKVIAGSEAPDKGAWTTSEPGKMGGGVEGRMIQRLVELAKEDLAKNP